ncbi:MAG: ATP-binding cassette domain-containing protein, partial [Bacteriovoracaceae bacterium]|nr:ATP-binding cassette domain-containing protein [Bacteriovoracaceae bacterium]
MLETVSSRKKSLFPTTASLLELKDYSVRFKQRFILKNLNLGIAIKEITFILGASGSGKTTLLRSLHKKNSLAQVTGERSLAQGACVMLMDEKDILLPDFLAIEHLQMVYEEKVHHDWEAFKREALNLFQHFNLSPLLSHKLKTWSQSEKQKLKLLLSLLASPDLLLLDNPFALLSRED